MGFGIKESQVNVGAEERTEGQTEREQGDEVGRKRAGREEGGESEWEESKWSPFLDRETEVQALRLSVLGRLAVSMLVFLFGKSVPRAPHPQPSLHLLKK